MLENVGKKQIIIAGILLLVVVVMGVFWYLIHQIGEVEEKIPELEKDLKEQTTAPSESLLSSEEEKRLIDNTTAPQQEPQLTPEQKQELVEAISAPWAE